MATRSLATRVARLTNMQVTVDKAGTKCHVSLPGLSFDDFDRTRNLSPIKLQSLLTACRIFAYHSPSAETGATFLDYDKLTADTFTFMASTKTTIERKFYDLVTMEKPPKLNVSVHLGYVGMSSLNSVAVLNNADSGEAFAHNVNQVVTVSKETRKPTPVADWWKEKYERAVVENERLVVKPLEVPETRHVYGMKVPWSDIDGYKHTNYVSYIKYCFDAAMDACVNGQLYSKIKDDVLLYHVKEIEIAYRGETKAGDALDVATWQNEEDPWKLHFDISKKGNSVFQSSINFYES